MCIQYRRQRINRIRSKCFFHHKPVTIISVLGKTKTTTKPRSTKVLDLNLRTDRGNEVWNGLEKV